MSIGRADNEKRLTKAGQAAVKLGKPHVVFTTMVNNYAKSVIAALERDGAAVFVDAPHDQIMAVLAGADALILSSRNATYCHVAMEAVAHGVPVIGTGSAACSRQLPRADLALGTAIRDHHAGGAR